MADNEDPAIWLIRKGNFYYRPNCQGYTADPAAAGRYTRAKAEREASVEPWHMTVEAAPPRIHLVDPAPYVATLRQTRTTLVLAMILARLRGDNPEDFEAAIAAIDEVLGDGT